MAESVSKEDIKKLIEKLYNGQKEGSRAEAAKALGRFEEEAKEAVPALLNALKNDQSERVRGRVALALGRINDSSVIPNLLDALENDKSDEVRARVAWALGDLGEAAISAIEPLKKAAKEKNNELRSFHFKISILKLEGLSSEILDELEKEKQEGKLERWQIIRLSNLLKELSLQEKVLEASNGIASVKDDAKTVENEVNSLREKVEQHADGQMKNDLLDITALLQSMIQNQQKTIERQEDTIQGLNVALQELMKAHQTAILEPRITAEQFQEFKDKGPKEKWIKRNLFALLGAIGTVLSGIAAVLGWLSSSLGWFG
ncbi:MAG: HEAT repeat domain-containing protein [Candidatus Heimdallarchaeota archaeon]|nr:HEAT repeat domain-containing protein [Candidatus Heimdallarchaeota archaeon]